MKLIKLFVFLFIISSCSQYLGEKEPDYLPKKEVTQISSSNSNLILQNISIDFENIKYPINKGLIENTNIFKLNKILSFDKNSDIYINMKDIFYSKKGKLIRMNKSNHKDKTEYTIDLDKDEHLIMISEFEGQILAFTNKSKLFKLNQESLNLLADFDTFVNSNPVLFNENIIISSVFGDILEINVNSNSIQSKGKISPNHGIALKSNTYDYGEYRSFLFNSRTLFFLNKFNNELQSNYYLEDLNILSSLDLFEEFIDAPFGFEDNLYFIEKNGLISVFNPESTEILWEVDMNTSIKDYLLSDKGHLALLTNDKVLVLNENGNLIFEINHNIEAPLLFLINYNKLYIFNSNGITIFNTDTKELEDLVKSKFNGNLDIVKSETNIFIKDTNTLFELSE
tara:strand:+ start:729 stop:1919 length:1191 start_codon:yes stop_codon:yes gene_type:complete